MNDAPSGYRVEQAMAAWMSARARLLADDPSLEDDEAALVDLLGDEEGEADEILARVGRAAIHAKSMAEAAAARKDDLAAREARYKARYETLRITGLAILDALGKPKLELPDITIGRRQGTPSVTITDEAILPKMYVREVTTTSPDKALLLAALKQQAALREAMIAEAREKGDSVDETKLPSGIAGAVLSNGSDSLTLRVK